MFERLAREAADRYRLWIGEPPDADSVPADRIWESEQLLSPLRLDPLLAAWMRELRANHPTVAASLLLKYYARSLCGAWMLLTLGNIRLDISLRETRFVWGPGMTPALWLPDGRADHLPADGRERTAARDAWLREITERHYRPLIEALSFRAGLSKAVGWENALIYLHHAYGEWRKQTNSPELLARIEGDYTALTAEGSPLHIRGELIDDPYRPGEQIRIRRTCCLKYALPDGKHCYTCPSLCDSKRQEMLYARAGQ